MNDYEDNLLAKGMMQNMAQIMGVELSEAEAEGKLTPEDKQQMIWRCDDCFGKSHCWNWLARSRAAGHPLEDGPNCPNHPYLAQLQPDAAAEAPAEPADQKSPA